MDQKNDDGAELAAVVNDTTAETPKRQAFTPGPWQTKRSEIRIDGEYDFAIYDAHRQVIAEAFGRTSETNFQPAEANAHLIASAPDLFSACVEAADFIEGAHGAKDRPGSDAYDCYQQLIAAILKAKGL